MIENEENQVIRRRGRPPKVAEIAAPVEEATEATPEPLVQLAEEPAPVTAVVIEDAPPVEDVLVAEEIVVSEQTLREMEAGRRALAGLR